MLKSIRKVCKREAKGTLLEPEQVLEYIRSGNYLPTCVTTLAKMRRDVITMYVSMEAAWGHINTKIDSLRDDVRGLCGRIPLEDYEEIMSLLATPKMKTMERMLGRIIDVCMASSDPHLDTIALTSERLIEEWSYHIGMYQIGLRALKIAKKCKPSAHDDLRTMLQRAWYDRTCARVSQIENETLTADLKRSEKRKCIIMQEFI